MTTTDLMQELAVQMKAAISRRQEKTARTTINASADELSLSHSFHPHVYHRLSVSKRLVGGKSLLDVSFRIDDQRSKDSWNERAWENNRESWAAYRCCGTISPDQATVAAIESWVAYLFGDSVKPIIFLQGVHAHRRSWRESDGTVKWFIVGGVLMGILAGLILGGSAGIVLAIVGAAVGYFLGAMIGAAVASW